MKVDVESVKWKIIKEVRIPNQSNRNFECECKCGKIRIISANALKYAKTKQCHECRFKTHGKSKTATYRIWAGLFTRCYNKISRSYLFYGALGISVCEEWKSFDKFLADMGERPLDMQLDRIDGAGNYERSNCRWVSKSENLKNKTKDTAIPMVGKTFGDWTVLERDFSIKKSHVYYKCLCTCGNIASVGGGFLRSGKSSRCVKCRSLLHVGWAERHREKKNEGRC